MPVGAVLEVAVSYDRGWHAMMDARDIPIQRELTRPARDCCGCSTMAEWKPIWRGCFACWRWPGRPATAPGESAPQTARRLRHKIIEL